MNLGQQSEGKAPATRSVAGNVIRGSLGNLIEWYDWYAYAAFSIYFASVFFPSGNPTAQLLITAGIFTVGFLIRPTGGRNWRRCCWWPPGCSHQSSCMPGAGGSCSSSEGRPP